MIYAALCNLQSRNACVWLWADGGCWPWPWYGGCFVLCDTLRWCFESRSHSRLFVVPLFCSSVTVVHWLSFLGPHLWLYTRTTFCRLYSDTQSNCCTFLSCCRKLRKSRRVHRLSKIRPCERRTHNFGKLSSKSRRHSSQYPDRFVS